MDQRPMEFESRFNIKDVTFENVSNEFEKHFRDAYNNSLKMMSDTRNPMDNASGANTLGILEQMAQRIESYDSSTDFERSYQDLLEEYRRFTET
ncbi:MAG: hypothetical protein N3B21_06815 [Clostridia bacterium]|nr:hypothetical protein [Clostridia bacterium]